MESGTGQSGEGWACVSRIAPIPLTMTVLTAVTMREAPNLPGGRCITHLNFFPPRAIAEVFPPFADKDNRS